MNDTLLFWSKKGAVACRHHAPDSSSPRWTSEQWQPIPVPETNRRRYRCQECLTAAARAVPEAAEASLPLILNVGNRAANLYARDEILRRHGFIVANAETGRGAIETARQLRPSPILLDIHLQDIDGRELCQRIKADPEFHDMPVLLITSIPKGHSEQLESVRWGNADGFIAEPVDGDALAAMIRKVIEAA
jgi:CheY-like chemotaxis protein